MGGLGDDSSSDRSPCLADNHSVAAEHVHVCPWPRQQQHLQLATVVAVAN